MGAFFFVFLNSMVSCVVFFIFVTTATASPIGSFITHLPGFSGTLPSSHFSGYVSLGVGNLTKNLFYYFVESEGNSAGDPLVLWLNGGPGCSSFDGFIYENGPFNFEKTGFGKLPKLHLNPYSWSKVSNIIYLDSPVGVGFSYSENEENYNTGDLRTADDTYNFLLKWFNLFPEYKGHNFFISGESYSGVYVPTLAFRIAQGNQKGKSSTFINLKGYMVGNAVTDQNIDNNALVPFIHGMGLISEDMFQGLLKKCGQNYYGNVSKNCHKALTEVNDVLSGLNIYNILGPCYHGDDRNDTKDLPPSFSELGKTKKMGKVRKRMYGRAWPLLWSMEPGLIKSWSQMLEDSDSGVPCMNDEIATRWLNDISVRKAIHASMKSGTWMLCTNRIVYTRDTESMIPYHIKLTRDLKFRALVYSGDHDMCVPFTGSEKWTSSLGFKVVDKWRPWHYNNQIAGFTQGYANNLTFLTVKGSGHTVPEYKPEEALYFYKRWLRGQKI